MLILSNKYFTADLIVLKKLYLPTSQEEVMCQ